MPDDPEYSDIHSSLRKAVFKILAKHHDLKPLEICKILRVSHKDHGPTVQQYRQQWKREYKKGLGLKALKFHNARGWIYALKMVERELALKRGWEETRSRSHMIVWNMDKLKLGRLEWFPTGRINFWIRKPATWGKVKQLLSNAFSWNSLIVDPQIFGIWVNTARFKGAHATYDYGEKVPYARIDFLKEALGVVIKTGDISDPTCLEIEFVYPDWAEKIEKRLEQNDKALKQSSQAIENFNEFMKDLARPRRLDPDQDREMIS